jgi:Methyltransferase small domain
MTLHMISLFIISILFLSVLSIVYKSLRNGISPMPSSTPVRQIVAAEIEKLGGVGTIVEAGSGWGALALLLAKKCKSAQVIGIENSIIPLWISKLTAMLNSNRNLAFIRGNLYTYSYEQANVVVCYLFPGAMRKLSPLLREQLAPGSYVISICFALPDWQPERIIMCRDLYQTKVYIYHRE